MKTMTDTKFLGVSAMVVAFLIAAVIVIGGSQPALGSVAVSNEYSRVNIAASNTYGATTTPGRTFPETIKVGGGSLGSVVITGAAAGVMNFYDATTTNVNWRTGNKATSTIIIASLPASLVAGTYVFDVGFDTGLLVDIIGTAPTSTVTFR